MLGTRHHERCSKGYIRVCSGALPTYPVGGKVFEWNPASMRILEKCGFVREGVLRASAIKDGQIIDRVMYALDSGRWLIG
jgi:RimJ/RimL family protein N-acetyltransferase